MHTYGSVNRAFKVVENHTTLALVSQASQKDGMAGLAGDMAASPQYKDFPHRHPLISSPSSPGQMKGVSGILFPPFHPLVPAWSHVPGLAFSLGHPRPSACGAHGGRSHCFCTEKNLHAWWGRDSLACLSLMLRIISINNATSASHAN